MVVPALARNAPPSPRSTAIVDPRIGNHGAALLALEDGSIFDGVAFGAPLAGGGDLVVNTSQTGYQEVCTDPSYAGQVVVMTYPLIGNYGRVLVDDQSARPWLRGLVVANATAAVLDDGAQLARLLRDAGIPAIAGVDTRALARHLRANGSLRGLILEPGALDRDAATTRAAGVPRWEDQDFVAEVSPAQVVEHGAGEGGPRAPRPSGCGSATTARTTRSAISTPATFRSPPRTTRSRSWATRSRSGAGSGSARST